MKKFSILFFTLMFLTSCSTQTSLFNNSLDQKLTKEGTHHFFFWGVGQTKNEDLTQICGDSDSIARTQTIDTFPNLLGQVLTLGVWLPRTYRVYCSDTASNLAPSDSFDDSVNNEDGGQS
tara:strand:+ start:271 stop:630 length:360 start_codon:yes stop_codon:yes gene_type:complete